MKNPLRRIAAVATLRSRKTVLKEIPPFESPERSKEPAAAPTKAHPHDERSRIEEFAFTHGALPESYDIVNSPGTVVRIPSGEGYLHVFADRKFWHISGGIVADELHKTSTVHWLKQLAQQQKRTIAVYSVTAEEVSLYREAGFAVNKLGEEPVIDLGDQNWQGQPYEWVRRQTNFCRRQGLFVLEITSRQEQHRLADELTEVFFDDLKDRIYSQPLRLLEGHFDPRALGRRRLFVARHQKTLRIEGFIIASPMENGCSWAFETYRKRRDAVRGTIPYLFREVIDQLQEEGVRTISLCLVPGKGAHDDKSKMADARVRWLLSIWYRRLDFLFSASGQDYFKSRFRPRYVDRYICVYPRNSLLSVFSFIKTNGALRINFKNAARKFLGAFRKSHSSSSGGSASSAVSVGTKR